MTGNFRELPLIRFLRSLDYLQMAAVAMLLCTGLIFIRSTGIQIDTPESLASFNKQLIWIALGTAVYFLMAALDYRSFSCRVAMLMGYAVSLVLLVVVLFFGLKIFGSSPRRNAGYLDEYCEKSKCALCTFPISGKASCKSSCTGQNIYIIASI